MTGTATGAIERSIVTALMGHAPLMVLGITGVYDALPARAVYPFVIYDFVWGSDVHVVGGQRAHTQALYQVRVCCDGGSVARMGAMAAAIDAALQGLRASNEDGQILACHREAPLKLPTEHTATGAYYSQGGTYRFLVQEE